MGSLQPMILSGGGGQWRWGDVTTYLQFHWTMMGGLTTYSQCSWVLKTNSLRHWCFLPILSDVFQNGGSPPICSSIWGSPPMILSGIDG
jgi:hypothetical protein